MSDKKLTIEELTKQYEDTKVTLEKLGTQLKKQKQEEEEKKKAELALQKDARRNEVVKAYDTLQELIKNYIKDYGKLELHSNFYEDGFFDFWNIFR